LALFIGVYALTYFIRWDFHHTNCCSLSSLKWCVPLKMVFLSAIRASGY